MLDFVDFGSFSDLVISYGLNLLSAILIFLIGRWVAPFASRFTRSILDRTKVSPTFSTFVANLVYSAIIVFAVVAALERLGIETTSIVALVGAAGLAIGLALEGALSNFAAGGIILLFRPFKVGDMVEVGDKLGRVEEIQIFNTIFVTLDNKTVVIPNSQITGGPLTNYSTKGILRLDLIYGISYDDDLRKAKQILQEIVAAEPRVLNEPAPLVAVSELGDSSVNFAVRPHVKVKDYWLVGFDITEQVKLRFDEEGISIPYPQHDIYLHSVER